MTRLGLLGVLALAGGAAGCVRDVSQVAGTGSTYTTRCSTDMEARAGQYFATCDPPRCDRTYHDGPVSHVVVALDPGRKIVGYAERICLQDLSQASQLFQPALDATRDVDPPSDDG